ncbi:hypothetical protein HOY80DRAFT_970912 [Tuber brumale]|nr:hypothetical protein HOY80DRAFT_970912 [Tuber brumale]
MLGVLAFHLHRYRLSFPAFAWSPIGLFAALLFTIRPFAGAQPTNSSVTVGPSLCLSIHLTYCMLGIVVGVVPLREWRSHGSGTAAGTIMLLGTLGSMVFFLLFSLMPA